jgi:hypothetical protein
MYPLMAHSGPIRIETVSDLSVFIFSDTPWIHIPGISDTYLYRIRIPRIQALVDVSLFCSRLLCLTHYWMT